MTDNSLSIGRTPNASEPPRPATSDSDDPGAMFKARTGREQLLYRLCTVPALGLILLVALVPLGLLFFRSLIDQGTGELTGRYYLETFTNAFFMRTLWTTVLMSSGVTILSIVMALPLAYLLARHTLLRNFVLPVITIPRMLPFVVIGYAMILLLAPITGVANRTLMALGILSEPAFILFDWPGQAFAFAYTGIVVATAILTGVLMSVDPQLEDASVSLGANRVRTYYANYSAAQHPWDHRRKRVDLHIDFHFLCYPRHAQRPCAVHDFGPHRVQLADPAAAASRLRSGSHGRRACHRRHRLGATLFAQAWTTGGQAVSLVRSSKRQPRRWTASSLVGKSLLLLYVFVMLAWMIFPIGLVILSSFQGRLDVSLSFDNLGFSAYEAIPRAYWESFWFTVRTAFLATAIALLIAVPAAWAMVRGKLRGRRIISSLVLIPDVVPQLILGIALLTVFIPLRLSNSFLGVLLAMVALSLAVGLRFTEALMEGLPEEYELAAQSMGASRLNVFRLIILPLMAPGIAIAALFIFMQNLIVFELLLFISGPNATPIAIRLFTDIVDRGVLPYAIAMAGILVYVAMAFYALVAVALGPKYMTGSIMSRKG